MDEGTCSNHRKDKGLNWRKSLSDKRLPYSQAHESDQAREEGQNGSLGTKEIQKQRLKIVHNILLIS